MLDMTDSLAPKSDQLDAVDLLAGPRTVTITAVRKGPSAEQPFNFDLAEFDRPWRPNKTMRRLIVKAWGPKTDAYVGRRMTLWRNPKVKWAGKAVGGIEISHMSHIDGPLTDTLPASQRETAAYRVEPLPDVSPADELAELRAAWQAATPEDRPAIEVRVKQLQEACE